MTMVTLMSKHFTIVIDRDIFAEYKKHYFSLKENSRKKKFYFFNNWKTKKKKIKYLYSPISLNEIVPISSMQYSVIKHQWGDFGEWLAKKYGHKNKMYKNAIVEFRIFNETKIRKDCDNYSSKQLNDGLFSKSGMFEDDSYFFINPFIVGIDYDKEYPRTEIRISIVDEKTKDIYEKMKIHIDNFSE